MGNLFLFLLIFLPDTRKIKGKRKNAAS